MQAFIDDSIRIIHNDFDGFQGMEGRLQIMQASMDDSIRIFHIDFNGFQALEEIHDIADASLFVMMTLEETSWYVTSLPFRV